MGAAPKLATLDYFEKRGGVPKKGLEPAAVPAALDACCVALARRGTKTLEEVAAPALRLLDKGQKPWEPDLARTVRRLIDAEKAAEGDRAKKIRAVSDYFYRGPIAQELDAWMRENGGLIRAEDLAAHVTRVEKPVSVDYRGHAIVKCGPWTQGPYLLETLRLLEGFDVRSMGHNSADAIHVTLEAMKLGLADRDVFYADPEFADVPIERLLSEEYADLRRPLIDLKKASLVQRPGDPRGMKPLLGEIEIRKGLGGHPNDTTTCVVADKWGNVVAATPSGWSGVVAGKTGIWLGTRLQSFNTWKGHPNCIQPGKRPRITLTPTLILKDGKPVAAISVAGGDGQDQVTLQLVLDRLDFGMSAADAVTAPRFQTAHFVSSFGQAPPKLGSLSLQAEIDEKVYIELASRGHNVSRAKAPVWNPVMITIDPRTLLLEAAGDPKAGRHAAAY
jgi:gamma-glutamyltranspeptidase/glutathione hydrolase